jgi:hypothetical protein
MFKLTTRSNKKSKQNIIRTQYSHQNIADGYSTTHNTNNNTIAIPIGAITPPAV